MRRSLALGVAVAALLASGCVAEPREPSPTEPPLPATTTTVPATTTTTLTVAEATDAFRSCLADSGVSVPEIPLDSEGRPRLELALARVDFTDPRSVEALGECSEHLTRGALDLSVWPALRDRVQAALGEFSECVRFHGVDGFPDPVEGFAGVGGPYSLDLIPYDDPDLEPAVETCRSRLVEGG